MHFYLYIFNIYSLTLLLLSQLNNGQNKCYNYDGHKITVVKKYNKKETNTNNLLNALVGFATYIVLCPIFVQT